MVAENRYLPSRYLLSQAATHAGDHVKSRKSVACPVETTLRVIDGRWKVLVLHHLLEEKKRFNELYRLLGGITHRTLTKQLRELEANGLIIRRVFAEVPPRVEYSITPLARKLEHVLLAMDAWGRDYEKWERNRHLSAAKNG